MNFLIISFVHGLSSALHDFEGIIGSSDYTIDHISFDAISRLSFAVCGSLTTSEGEQYGFAWVTRGSSGSVKVMYAIPRIYLKEVWLYSLSDVNDSITMYAVGYRDGDFTQEVDIFFDDSSVTSFGRILEAGQSAIIGGIGADIGNTGNLYLVG